MTAFILVLRPPLAVMVFAASIWAWSLPPEVQAQEGVPEQSLKSGLMAALGESFEFVDAEAGRVEAPVRDWVAERFWFAMVRAKAAGEFAISYEAKFPDVGNNNERRLPERATYTLHMKVGQRGAARIIRPGGYTGSAWPHCNVGDTLIIAVHIDRHLSGHRFNVADMKDQSVVAFFAVANESPHDSYLKRVAEKQVVKNEAADRLDLLASWGISVGNRPGTATGHRLRAYLEFTQPGSFNIAGRLADAGANHDQPGTPLRVVTKEEPVTAVVEAIRCVEHTGESTYHTTNSIPSGTLEVRVGDRIVVDCGSYSTPGLAPVEYRPAVVSILPFKARGAYRPEAKK